MKLRAVFGVLFALIFAVSGVSEPLGSVNCLGGDGPNPLLDLSSSLPAGIEMVMTDGFIRDFAFWEKSNRLAYRDQEQRLLEMSLDGEKEPRLLSYLNRPLSKVMDPTEKYLTLEDHATVMDTSVSHPSWMSWAHDYSLRHLYWNQEGSQNVLYSLESVFVTPAQQQLQVLAFYPGGNIQPHRCVLPTKPGEVFHIGEGHDYPYVFLYKVRKEAAGTKLTLYKIKIEGGLGACRLWKVQDYERPLPGNVTEVYHFPKLSPIDNRMFVVRTDHPTKNLLWDDGPNDCRYYNLGGREPIILNPNQPVIAAWSSKEGLSLIYPRRKVGGNPVMIQVLKDFTQGTLRKKDLWLTDDGKRLLVAAGPVCRSGRVCPSSKSKAEEEEELGRLLFDVDLTKVQGFAATGVPASLPEPAKK